MICQSPRAPGAAASQNCATGSGRAASRSDSQRRKRPEVGRRGAPRIGAERAAESVSKTSSVSASAGGRARGRTAPPPRTPPAARPPAPPAGRAASPSASISRPAAARSAAVAAFEIEPPIARPACGANQARRPPAREAARGQSGCDGPGERGSGRRGCGSRGESGSWRAPWRGGWRGRFGRALGKRARVRDRVRTPGWRGDVGPLESGLGGAPSSIPNVSKRFRKVRQWPAIRPVSPPSSSAAARGLLRLVADEAVRGVRRLAPHDSSASEAETGPLGGASKQDRPPPSAAPSEDAGGWC